MLPATPLTADDLDAIGSESFGTGDRRALATELADAVEQGRLADPAEAGYALTLAAEITARDGALEAAEEFARRAVTARREHDLELGYPEAYHAELLLRLGREDEGWERMSTVRPLLLTDPDASSYVTDVLVESGHQNVAHEWLTEATEQALRRRESLESRRDEAEYGDAAEIAYHLVQRRYHLRRDLGLSHDSHDDVAVQLAAAIDEALAEEVSQPAAVMYWPEHEFSQLLGRWPELKRVYGSDWDEHRQLVELTLTAQSASGRPRLGLFAGSVDDLADFVHREDSDPTDDAERQRYVDQALSQQQPVAWPPSRNDPCWCGSDRKYKKCCRPRAQQ